MWKRFFVVILILAAAVIVDLLYDIAIQTAGETFDLRLSVALFWLRPVILVTAYTCILIAGYSLIVTNQSGRSISALLIVVGLAVLYVTTFPPGSRYPPTRGLYNSLVILSASRLGLTFHAGAFLVAAGIVRLLQFTLRLRTQPSQ